jgi:ribosomal protection tetracycline resistance protein
MKTLRALRVPTLIFVNKIDRAGAREAELLDDIRRLLSPYCVVLNGVRRIGRADASTVSGVADGTAEVLAEHDDELLELLVEGRPAGPGQIRRATARQCADGVLHPVLFGSALTGQGIDDLLDAIRLLPATPARSHPAGDQDGQEPPVATVFAIGRGAAGEKIAYLRLRSGVLRARQRVTFHRRGRDGTAEEYGGRPTGLEVSGSTARQAVAGDIAKVWGVPEIRVGDRLGAPAGSRHDGPFARPGLETVVRPRVPGEEGRLHAALAALAEQDPLIGTRALPGGETTVLLYGEVQKEVIAETLAGDFGVEAVFEPSRPVYLERPAGAAEAVEEIRRHGRNDFWATVGLRVEPAPTGSGVGYRLGVDLGSLPLAFHRAIEDSVRDTLRAGPRGWPVTDVRVTLTRTGYASPLSTAGDFRGRTPRVLMRALRRAGTRVFEPCHRFELEIPPEALSAVTVRLAALGAEVAGTAQRGNAWVITGDLPSRSVPEFERQLPGLSHGEGVWWSQPSGDRPVTA